MTTLVAPRHSRPGPRPLAVGSLCTGYGGLDLAVAELFPTAAWAWCADDDRHISAVIAARFPAVANLGDIRAVDWPHVARSAPVDIVTAGFPCQDISLAGTGEGIARGNRSGLWFTVLDAVRALRPGLLVLENVAALRRRGLDTVLAGLAQAGYDAQWTSVRAGDVGAPHRRDRCFLTGWPAPHLPPTAHPARPGRLRAGAARRPAHRDHDDRGLPRHCTRGSGPPVPHRAAALSRGHCCSPRRRTSAGAAAANHRASAAPQATDRPWPTSSNTGTPHRTTTPTCPRQPTQPGHRRTAAAAAHPDRQRSRQRLTAPTRRPVLRVDAPTPETPRPAPPTGPEPVWNWGPYEPAVTRWTALLGRRPPHPVQPGPHGKPRLNPAFVEWMMGLPTDPGWVTDVPGLPRGAQLRALGNGVVPQQALHALRELGADTAATGTTNLLTAQLARTPRHHDLRTHLHPDAPPRTAPPPQTHHPSNPHPHPRRATAVTHTADTTTWPETDHTTDTDTDTAATTAPARRPLLLTPDEAGPLVHRSGGWMRRKAAAGEIPCTVLGRTILFSDTDLDDLVVMHHRPATNT